MATGNESKPFFFLSFSNNMCRSSAAKEILETEIDLIRITLFEIYVLFTLKSNNNVNTECRILSLYIVCPQPDH